MEMGMIIVAFIIAYHLLGVIMFVGSIYWIARELLVRSPRRKRWIEEHGSLIGSEEFYKWCVTNNTDPGLYF